MSAQSNSDGQFCDDTNFHENIYIPESKFTNMLKKNALLNKSYVENWHEIPVEDYVVEKPFFH
jgi:hypothetical protein